MQIQYRFIGTEEQAKDYGSNPPIINKEYFPNSRIGDDNDTVARWYNFQEKYWNDDEKEWVKINSKDREDIKKPSTEAMRFNSGKPNYSLLNLAAFEDTVKVLEFGAKKYERDNWEKGFPFSTILDSMMRHIKGLQQGEWLDPESGLPHIGHIGCNAMFLGGKNNTMDLKKLQEEFEKWKQLK